MLSPEQVQPLLLHENHFVRKEAAGYMADSFQRDWDLVPMILEAYERFGDE